MTGLSPLRKTPVGDDLFTQVQAAIYRRDAAAARALYPRFKAVVEGDPQNAMYARDLDAIGALAGATVDQVANAAPSPLRGDWNAFRKYSADQGRDDHGRFASGGGAGGSGDDRGAIGASLNDAPESKWDEVKSIAKSVAVGAALTAAASIAAALAPEAFAIAAGAAAGEAAAAGGASAAEAVAAATTTGQFGFVTAQVKNLAQTAYWSAGLKTARLGLKSLGVNVAAIDQYVKPVEQAYNAVFKVSTSAGIDPRLIEIISGVGDHVHKALLDHIPPQTDIASVINSVAASEGIDAALIEYKSSINALGKSAPVDMRNHSVARSSRDAVPTFKTYAERQRWEAAQFFEMAYAAAGCTAAMRKLGDDDPILRKNASLAAAVTSLADLEARLRRLATQPLPLPLRTMEAAGSA